MEVNTCITPEGITHEELYRQSIMKDICFPNTSDIGGHSTDVSQIGYSIVRQMKEFFPPNGIPDHLLKESEEIINELQAAETHAVAFVKRVNQYGRQGGVVLTSGELPAVVLNKDNPYYRQMLICPTYFGAAYDSWESRNGRPGIGTKTADFDIFRCPPVFK